MKRVLINATHEEEVRVALVDGQHLYDLNIESRVREQKVSNIYNGKVTQVVPHLEAVFVDFGSSRHGFLPLKNISHKYFKTDPEKGERVNLQDAISEGMEMIVQVSKDERGTKGATLTNFYSIAGRYLVFTGKNPSVGGVSRHIGSREREELKESLAQLTIPDDAGLIIRTAGVGRSIEELQWDLNNLMQLSESIEKAAGELPAPAFLYQENDIVVRTVSDNLRDDVGEIILDSREAWEKAVEFTRQFVPGSTDKVKLYEGEMPLFNRYQVESQIESAYQREVKLPSGGSLVFDPTEALLAIDVNSAQANKGKHFEETALSTNLEAADEIGRQLRLRDLGGLVVIDFIDMPYRDRVQVENRMREALKRDRARIQVGRISQFGLLELSRQRLRLSLGETSSGVCPRCSGTGHIRDVESLALLIMRLMEEEARKTNSAEIQAVVPVPVAAWLLNEKRSMVSEVEERNKVRLLILPSADLETPHYSIRRVRQQEEEMTSKASYLIDTEVETEQPEEVRRKKPAEPEAPAVQLTPKAHPTGNGNTRGRKRPTRNRKKQHRPKSLISRLLGLLTGKSQAGKPASKAGGKKQQQQGGGRRNPARAPQNRNDNRQPGQREAASRSAANNRGGQRKNDKSSGQGQRRRDPGSSRVDSGQKTQQKVERTGQEQRGQAEPSQDRRNQGNRRRSSRSRSAAESQPGANQISENTPSYAAKPVPEASPPAEETKAPQASGTVASEAGAKQGRAANDPRNSKQSAEVPESRVAEPSPEYNADAGQSAAAEDKKAHSEAAKAAESTRGQTAETAREAAEKPAEPEASSAEAAEQQSGTREEKQPARQGRAANDPRNSRKAG